MSKKYYISKEVFISYNEHKSKKILPTIVFLHGLNSSKASTKAQYLENFCKESDIPFIAFDALGHGESSEKFTDQSVDSWLTSAEIFLKDTCRNGSILVGSSMGGWISILIAMRNPDFVKKLVCVAPAPDFTEEMLEGFSKTQKASLAKNEITLLEIGHYIYHISPTLIQESKKHLLMHKNKIEITCPVDILHGMKDTEVSYKKSIELVNKLSSNNVKLTLVKNGTHSLSSETDLAMLSESIKISGS
ncbi:MAG: hypothetical protein RLZZ59_463 [Pseudomonadota bacterium]|jgi:pimeloyl-ACP methyl ester carboxylesterase